MKQKALSRPGAANDVELRTRLAKSVSASNSAALVETIFVCGLDALTLASNAELFPDSIVPNEGAIDAEELPIGWQRIESRSRPGQYSYLNLLTNKRVAERPLTPAVKGVVNLRHLPDVQVLFPPSFVACNKLCALKK